MRCANPQCHTESDYLRSGSLYQIAGDSPGRQGRFIWLCSHCSPRFRVETWRPPGQQLQLAPGPDSAGKLLPGRQRSAAAHPRPLQA
jgi:hypothetical protein